jgi:hypothetical protein
MKSLKRILFISIGLLMLLIMIGVITKYLIINYSLYKTIIKVLCGFVILITLIIWTIISLYLILKGYRAEL